MWMLPQLQCSPATVMLLRFCDIACLFVIVSVLVISLINYDIKSQAAHQYGINTCILLTSILLIISFNIRSSYGNHLCIIAICNRIYIQPRALPGLLCRENKKIYQQLPTIVVASWLLAGHSIFLAGMAAPSDERATSDKQ